MKKEFAQYVWSTRYKSVRLYGCDGEEFVCTVLKSKRGSSKVVKFGKNWKGFIAAGQYVADDVLNFRFVNKSCSNLIRVVHKEV